MADLTDNEQKKRAFKFKYNLAVIIIGIILFPVIWLAAYLYPYSSPRTIRIYHAENPTVVLVATMIGALILSILFIVKFWQRD